MTSCTTSLNKKLLRSVAPLALAGMLAPCQPLSAEEIKLEFGTNTAFEMAEQDVFVEGANGSVHRIAASEVESLMDSALFGATESPPFQPLNLEPTEEYGKEIDLGITLRDWLSATATGTYACDGGESVFDIEFSNLAPNAVYTMWNFFDANPPTDPWQSIMYPLGARDGADATFQTGADGNAVYSVRFEPCVELTGTQTLAGIAAAWHPDGKTHGASPGALGRDSFAHVMAALMQ